MKAKYLIVAGPQASGKSTLIQHLSSQLEEIIPLEETRRVIVHQYQLKGAIFMTDLHEIQVIHNDFERMFSIIGTNGRSAYIDETNIFTIGHARAHGIDLLEGYWRQYTDMLPRMEAAVLFINVPPDISWERRKYRYAQRLWNYQEAERDNIMRSYKDYLYRLQPELENIFCMLDIPKIKIQGTGNASETLRLALQALDEI